MLISFVSGLIFANTHGPANADRPAKKGQRAVDKAQKKDEQFKKLDPKLNQGRFDQCKSSYNKIGREWIADNQRKYDAVRNVAFSFRADGRVGRVNTGPLQKSQIDSLRSAGFMIADKATVEDVRELARNHWKDSLRTYQNQAGSVSQQTAYYLMADWNPKTQKWEIPETDTAIAKK